MHLILACLILWVFIVTLLFSVYPSRGSTGLSEPNKAPVLMMEDNINSICYVSMKAKTLVCAVVQEYLNSILKAPMCSPSNRQISGFRFVLLLGKVIHSNEVL